MNEEDISFSKPFEDSKVISFKDYKENPSTSLVFFRNKFFLLVDEKEISFSKSFKVLKELSFKDEKENSFFSLKSFRNDKTYLLLIEGGEGDLLLVLDIPSG